MPEVIQPTAEPATTAAATTEPAPVEGAEPPANGVVANDVADPDAPANDTEAKPEPEKADKPAALFNRAMKFREEANAKLQKAEQTMVDFHRQRADFHREQEAITKERAVIAQERAKIERIKEDPHLFFELFDVDPADHMRRMMAMSEPVAREIASERKKREELEKKIEEQEKQRQTEAVSVNVQRAKSTFVDFLSKNHQHFPDIADEDPSEVVDVFWELATEHHKNTGKAPTLEMVAKYMQRQADDKRAKREARRTQRSGAQPATAPSEPGGGSNTAPQRTAPNGQPANGPGLRTAPATLTNRSATVVASAPREDATDEELNEWSLRELRRLRQASSDT